MDHKKNFYFFPLNLYSQIKDYSLMLRPKQWIKNFFIFAPLLFSGQFTSLDSLYKALTVYALFCLAASLIYILNDCVDLAADQQHPIKSKTRPLASGRVSKSEAIGLMLFLSVILSAQFFWHKDVMLVITGYVVLNIGYSFYLKHQPILDIFTIASGFVLRVYAGAVAIHVPLSDWMFVTTLCLALYLAAIKRSKEIHLHGQENRKVLRFYTEQLTNRFAEMAATGALIFYSLFVMSTNNKLIFTIPLVLFGLFRYWLIVETSPRGESPTSTLFSDTQLQVVITLWAITCMVALKA
jgi:decaprenyl-phosphate phosphoribosyltransferase